jgi:KDO2-lipid IV(A) lauroyltransferase
VSLAFASPRRLVLLARDFLLAVPVAVIAAPLWLLPWRGALALGAFYGRCAFFLWPVAGRAGMINLRRAYGQGMDRGTARRRTLEVFGSLGRGIAEGIQFSRRFKRGGDWRRLCVPEDPELEARIVADPRPKIFVTAHLGSWELAMATASLRAGSPGAAIARRVDNPFLNAAVRRLRVKSASEWIEKRGAAPEALRRLCLGENVAMLADENAGPRGVFVEFFGRPASTHKTPALLSALSGAPIVAGAALRRGGRFVFKLAVIEPRAASGSRHAGAEIRRLTSEMAAVFEAWIRQDPWQWRWIHWRWRHRPDGAEETYTRRDVTACFEESPPSATWQPAGGASTPGPDFS